jgi:hypothetical protein
MGALGPPHRGSRAGPLIAAVATEMGTFAVDVDEDELVDDAVEQPVPATEASVGSTRVRIMGYRPPLVVSHDAGITWHEAGGGLPEGRAIAIHPDDPDLMLYAGRNRLFVSRDGGRFWTALTAELPEIEAVAFVA